LRVGEETSFTVHWQLTNPGNDVANVEITAKLPAGIEWDNRTQANNSLPVPAYNPNSGEVTWSFAKLPYGSGIFNEKYEGSFRIKAKPSSTQKGTNIQLLDSAQFTGTDDYTKQAIALSRNALSSDNIADQPRNGSVQ
jgi:hypothetical protein